jgi:AraC family transcriptional regulator, transcriptional activator of pobA
MVFQAPHLLYSFLRYNSANGYLIYFKKDLFSFFKPDFEDEFPMFDLLHISFFKLNQSGFKYFKLFLKLLLLSYQLKEFTKNFNRVEESFKTPQHILLQKFTQLVNNFYLDKRTIDEYA